MEATTRMVGTPIADRSTESMASNFDERVALDALGRLTEEEQHALQRERQGQGVSAEAASVWYEAAAALADAFPPLAPAPGLRDAILARVSQTPPKPFVAPALSFVMHDEGWLQHPAVAGIRLKQLSLDEGRGIATLLMKVAPGTVYPSHHHQGHEECYVIDGDLQVAGRELGPGDFHHADGGSDHGTLHTVGGCTVLLVVDIHDYLG